MLPLRDSEAARRLTLSTTLIIAINLAVFTYEVHLNGGGGDLARYAMIPAAVAQVHPVTVEAHVVATLITSQFLHAGILHIAGNMLYLLIFGPAIEHRMGHLRFIIFYLLAGIVAAIATVVMAPASWIPVIGASGAIAGVLGAYFVLFPRGRITTIWLFRSIEVPAIFYLLIWFALQLYSGIANSNTGAFSGVAWWSHVGGFLFGVASAPIVALAQNRPKPRITAR
jgi:membrane associated rhomboid family serine protease